VRPPISNLPPHRRRGLVLTFPVGSRSTASSVATGTDHGRYKSNPEAPSFFRFALAANRVFACVWLRWAAREDYEQEQEMEVEALQAILMDDIKGFTASSKLFVLGTRAVDSNFLSKFDRCYVVCWC
jgi:hypothetical protein